MNPSLKFKFMELTWANPLSRFSESHIFSAARELELIRTNQDCCSDLRCFQELRIALTVGAGYKDMINMTMKTAIA